MKKIQTITTVFDVVLVLDEKECEEYKILCIKTQGFATVELKTIPKSKTQLARLADYYVKGHATLIEYNDKTFEIHYGYCDITDSKKRFEKNAQKYLGKIFLGNSFHIENDAAELCEEYEEDDYFEDFNAFYQNGDSDNNYDYDQDDDYDLNLDSSIDYDYEEEE